MLYQVQNRFVAQLYPGVMRLFEEPALLVNGAKQDPFIAYYLGDAGASNLPARGGFGATLAILGAGTTPDLAVPSAFTDEAGATFKGTGGAGDTGKAYQASENNTGELSTEDLILAQLFIVPAVDCAAAGITHKRDGAVVGWDSRIDTSFYWRLYFYTGSAGTAVVIPGTLVPRTLVLVTACVNRDEASTNGSQAYMWGTAAGSGVDMSARSGSLSTPTIPFKIGALTNTGAYAFHSTIHAVLAWKRSSWFSSGATGRAQMDAVAKHIASVITGGRLPWHPTGDANRIPTVL